MVKHQTGASRPGTALQSRGASAHQLRTTLDTFFNLDRQTLHRRRFRGGAAGYPH